MIDAFTATIILVAFIVLFGVALPILDIKHSKFISYRWCVIVVVLALLIGAVVDFNILSDEARKIVLVGGLVIVGVYVALRTIEKALSKGWLKGASIEVKKGDLSATVKSEKDEED